KFSLLASSFPKGGRLSICVFEPVCVTRSPNLFPMQVRPIRHLNGNGNVCLWLRREDRIIPVFVLHAARYSELMPQEKICLHAGVVQRSAPRNEIGIDPRVPVSELETVSRVERVLAPRL